MPRAEETADRWFDDPAPGRSATVGGSAGHGSYRGLDLELLHLADEADLTFPIESIHPELAYALGSEDEVIVGGEPFSPRLHILMYQIVANQLLVGDPAETWQTVHRLAALGYDWRRK